MRARRIPEALQALRGQARVWLSQHRHEEAEELGLLSREIAHGYSEPRPLARAINLLATIDHARERFDDAERRYHEALDIARSLADDELIGQVCQNLGVLANIRGDLREARLLYLECIASCVRASNRLVAMTAYNNLGMVCSDLSDWMEAELYFERGIEIAEQLPHLPYLARLLVNQAEPRISVGELTEAERSLARAESVAKRIGDAAAVSNVFRFRARIARVRGEYSEAGELLERALDLATHAGVELERAEVLREWAQLCWVQGEREEGLRRLEDARSTFERLGARRDAGRAANEIARWQEELSRPPSAAES